MPKTITKKVEHLRTILERIVPNYAPDRLAMYLSDGKVIAQGCYNQQTNRVDLSHRVSYTLEIFIEDYNGDLASLTTPILAFLAVNEHQLLENPSYLQQGVFKFEAEPTSTSTSQINITLELTESVVVIETEDSYSISIKDEPQYSERAENLRVYLQGNKIKEVNNGNSAT